MLKQVLQWSSPGGAKAPLSVLIFHQVLSQPDFLFPEEMHAGRFDEVCRWLKTWFNVLPLDEAGTRLRAGTLPARSACITFDDGYADNYHVALPILRRHSLTATFFIATGFLDGGCMWNDTIIESIRACTKHSLDLSTIGLGFHACGSVDEKRAAISALIDQIKYRQVEQRVLLTEKIAKICRVQLPRNLMMSPDEVKAMHRAGMQIGAHTVSHPILAQLSNDKAREEIQRSKCSLELLLGERVSLFAYPNGKPSEDYTVNNVEVVRSLDFDTAVSTQWGASRMGADYFQIRRFTPWDRTKLRFGIRMLANLRGLT